MILEVLKYILIVLGIIVVGAFIIYALASLMLAIVDPHAKDAKNDNNNNTQLPPSNANQQIYYEQPKLLNQPEPQIAPVEEQKIEQNDVKDVDLNKAKEEELALSQGNKFAELNQEEDAYIKEQQKKIEERISAKKEQEQPKADDEINLDDIFVDANDEEPEKVDVEDDDNDEDIEALINKILAESESNESEEDNTANTEENKEETEEVVEETPAEEIVEEAQPATLEETSETTPVEEQIEEQPAEEQAEQPAEEVKDDSDERIKALEEELARQKEEYENKLKDAESAKEQENHANDERIKELQEQLAEKERLLKESEENRPTGAMLTLEEYEARLEVLKDRLATNEKEFRAVKKEYLPLAKIKKSYEKDKIKLRRKEALVAKQKVVLYGVNNFVDIDEEKAKKLSEDLDLLDGLRLSVQHCEEVLKQNEERFPILENSYNILLATNENLKADIAECTAKIEQLKAEQE